MRKKWIPEEVLTVGSRPTIPPSVVKSAGRVMQIFELFDDFKREMCVVEICKTLNIPQSSTSVLLKSLTVMGFLHYNGADRTYIPTSRLALLGSWVNSDVVREGPLIRLMEDLNERTGSAIVLAIRNDLNTKYIHVLQSTNLLGMHVTLGTERSLVLTGIGRVILSTYPDSEISRIVWMINDRQPESEKKVSITHMLREIEIIRERGYAFDPFIKAIANSGGVIAMLLPITYQKQPLVIGVGGATETMIANESEIVATMKTVISSYFQEERVA